MPFLRDRRRSVVWRYAASPCGIAEIYLSAACGLGGTLACIIQAMALRPRPALEAAIRSRIARVAVGPSAVRGSPRGTAEAARRFLRQLPLRSFRARNRETFVRSLDRETIRLPAALPARGRRWGVARKLLNIYMRDCVYSAHLRSAHGLGNRAGLRSAPRLHHGKETPGVGRRGFVADVARCWTSESRSQRALPSRCDSNCQDTETGG